MSWRIEKGKLGKEITIDLYEHKMIRTWYRDKASGWTLVSGIWSPFYIQTRSLCLYPKLLRKVGYAMGKMIREETNANKIIGVAMTGVPIATAIAMLEDIPAGFTRKRAEDHGEHAMVENLADGDRVVVVDDLVTKFDSKLIAIDLIKRESERQRLSVECSDVAVIIDREQGASEVAMEHDISLHSLIPFKKKGLEWLKDVFSEEECRVIADYLGKKQSYFL